MSAVGACALLCAYGLPAAARADGTAVSGDAVASVHGSDVVLRGSRIERRWRISPDGVTGTSLSDPGRADYAGPGPDFSLDLGAIGTSSVSSWRLVEVAATRAGSAVQVTFRYRLLDGAQGTVPELERVFSLYPGAAVIGSRTRLTDRGILPLRVGAATLEQIQSSGAERAEIQAYHGGSDWRDDYRVVRRPGTAFDLEGQVASYDDGGGSGFFEVSGRRGGAASRAARDSQGMTSVGVDWARDIFDFGPLVTDPPNYNHLENFLYPVPVRERTVLPGETLDLGRAWVGVYHGGAQEAAFNFADAFARWVLPRFPRTVGINSFHPWGHGSGLSEANLRAQVDAAKALGVESYMLDDQWQGGAGGESGDWRFDPQRFPDRDKDGTPDFVAYVHSQGLELGLWMSPAEFHMDSQTYAAHRDWVCVPLGAVSANVPDDAGLGAWDFTNAGLRAYMTGVVDRLVRAYDVREFKFDFMAWLDCGTRDYNDYEDAFAGWVADLERRHPAVTFELDETNDQRLWAFRAAQTGPTWFDNGHVHNGAKLPAKILHDAWTAAPWIPPSLIGTGLFDGTLKPPYSEDEIVAMGLLGHITLWTDLTKLKPRQAARARRWFGWYKHHRSTLGGAAYELTAEDPLDGKPWAAFQPWDPRAGAGAVVAIRQGGGPSVRRLRLHGLKARHRYTVRRGPADRLVGRYSGAALMSRGLRVALPSPQSAAVYSLR